MLYTGVMDKTIYMLWFFFLITGLAVLWSNFSSDSEFTNIISTYSSQACLWGNTINVKGYHKHFHFIHSGYVKCIHYVVFSFSAKESCKNNDIEVVKIWRYKKKFLCFLLQITEYIYMDSNFFSWEIAWNTLILRSFILQKMKTRTGCSICQGSMLDFRLSFFLTLFFWVINQNFHHATVYVC